LAIRVYEGLFLNTSAYFLSLSSTSKRLLITSGYPINNSTFAILSVCQNITLISTSSRTVINKVYKTDVITILSKETITAGQSIGFRWNTNLGTLSLVNKSLTLMKIQ
jgi:hypothetical protein